MQHHKIRVAVVVSHPIQHFCPQYCSWAKMPGIELIVFFASRHGLDSYHDINFGRSIKWNLLLDFDHAFLPGADGRAVQAGLDSEDIEVSLDEFSPDVVICYGYSQALQRRVIRWADVRNRSLLMIADSELRQHRNPLKALAKKFVLPGVFSKVDVFLTVGDANEALSLIHI